MTTGVGSYEWRFDSGRVCLDLVATGEPAPKGFDDEPRGDDAGLLGRWLTGSGLVPRGTPLTGVDTGWVQRFAELRDCVGQLVRAEIDGRQAAAALERVNAVAAWPPRRASGPYANRAAVSSGHSATSPNAARCSRSWPGTPWTC